MGEETSRTTSWISLSFANESFYLPLLISESGSKLLCTSARLAAFHVNLKISAAFL